MKKGLAKIVTGWIPSARYRRTLRRALCDVPSEAPVRKCALPAGTAPSDRTLVVSRGFVNSGSGVIGDLLSEYEDVTAFSGIDPHSSARWNESVAGSESFEFDLFRMYGGIADLASAFGQSAAWGRMKLQNFIHAAEFLYRRTTIPLFDEAFIERLTGELGIEVDA